MGLPTSFFVGHVVTTSMGVEVKVGLPSLRRPCVEERSAFLHGRFDLGELTGLKGKRNGVLSSFLGVGRRDASPRMSFIRDGLSVLITVAHIVASGFVTVRLAAL